MELKEMLIARESLMNDIETIAEDHNGSDELIRELCDSVCRWFSPEEF